MHAGVLHAAADASTTRKCGASGDDNTYCTSAAKSEPVNGGRGSHYITRITVKVGVNNKVILN